MNCSVNGCNRKVLARGWCGKHYQRRVKYKNPNATKMTERGLPLHFLHKIAIPYQGNNCLIWPYCKSNDGYAGIRVNGRSHTVSRLICELVNGIPPTNQKYEAAHICGNGQLGCVNPKHLKWKTPKDNKSDELIHGTRNRGEKHGLSKLTEKQVIIIRKEKGLLKNIAKRFSVSPDTISSIKLRKTWKHLTEEN